MKNISIKVRLGIMIGITVTLAMAAVAVARITTDISISIASAERRLSGNTQMIEIMLSEFDHANFNPTTYNTGAYYIALADTAGNVIFSNKPGY